LVTYVVGLSLLLASCSGDAVGRAGSDSPETQEAEASETTLIRTDTVRVILDEYSVGIPKVLPPGETVFRLESRGFEEHNLLFVLIDSDSVVWETERRLSPYETRTVTVDLVPGAYTVVCDFSGHEDRGMFTQLLVKPQAVP
jgi:uncharacterized cupredoxin-like copper-binding protein